MDANIISRAQGCLLGQLSGDSLGSLVEFMEPDEILFLYPDGVRDFEEGGVWDTLDGQPTDDSEMALTLARLLVKTGIYDADKAREEYVAWLYSRPFDCGETTIDGLTGNPNFKSQANGALMRISPLGIWGSNFELRQVADWAKQDASITHPNPICSQVNALFAMGIAHAIKSGCDNFELYENIRQWAIEMNVDSIVLEIIDAAQMEPPVDYLENEGWVLTAFQNALYQLCNAPNLEEGIVDSIMQGGDTDTNAAICGALLGSVYGRNQIPQRWIDGLQSCRPSNENPKSKRPRPEKFWPTDVLELSVALLEKNHFE